MEGAYKMTLIFLVVLLYVSLFALRLHLLVTEKLSTLVGIFYDCWTMQI